MTKLEAIRKERGMRPAEIAKILHTSPQAVYQQETRGIRTITTAQRYAKALKCNPLDIIEL